MPSFFFLPVAFAQRYFGICHLLYKIVVFYTKFLKMLKFLKNNEKFIVKTIDFLNFVVYI